MSQPLLTTVLFQAGAIATPCFPPPDPAAIISRPYKVAVPPKQATSSSTNLPPQLKKLLDELARAQLKVKTLTADSEAFKRKAEAADREVLAARREGEAVRRKLTDAEQEVGRQTAKRRRLEEEFDSVMEDLHGQRKRCEREVRKRRTKQGLLRNSEPVAPKEQTRPPLLPLSDVADDELRAELDALRKEKDAIRTAFLVEETTRKQAEDASNTLKEERDRFQNSYDALRKEVPSLAKAFVRMVEIGKDIPPMS